MDGYTIRYRTMEGGYDISLDTPIRGERWIRNFIKNNIPREEEMMIETHYGIFDSEGDLIRTKQIDYLFHYKGGRLYTREG